MTTTYKIVRMYQSRAIKTGLTLAEAQEHCRDPETSSRTCTKADGRRRTERLGAWFDGYEED
jgi:hypothetical protein